MIRGIKKIDHIGMTVPNIKEASDYFKEWFGAKEVGKAWGFKSDDTWMQDYLNVHPRAEIEIAEMLELPDGTVLEIFQYNSPD